METKEIEKIASELIDEALAGDIPVVPHPDLPKYYIHDITNYIRNKYPEISEEDRLDIEVEFEANIDQATEEAEANTEHFSNLILS